MTTAQEIPAESALNVPGDVDASTGNLDAESDIVIAGTVRETLRVKSTGNVTIGGSIEAGAVVEAGGDVRIEGGITTQHRGMVSAGGAIYTHYCDEADLKAGGDVVVTGGVINSNIYTTGRLLIEQGALVGGTVYVRDGAVIKALGNENRLKTRIAVGINPDVLAENRRQAKDFRKQKEASERIRQAVQPLLAQLKRLNPQQRERATELMYEAESIDTRVNEQMKLQNDILAACTPAAPAELLVTGCLFPGTVVIFADKMTTIAQEREGPVKIARRHVTRTEEIVLEEPAAGATATLVSHEYEPVSPADVQRQ